MKPPSQPPATSPSRRPSPEASEGVLPRRSIIQRVLAYRRLWILATVVYVLDQLTKGWIAGRLNYPTYGPPFHLPVIDGFFNLVHVGNTGAAWSILSGYGRLLGGFALLTLVAIFFWRKMLGLRNPTVQWCFGGLCGGTVGNLTDRFRYGHVVDFLDFRFGSYAYPSFNVADMGIVIGVFGFIVWSVRHPTPPEE